MSYPEIQEIYETTLAGYTSIVFDDLVPKTALYIEIDNRIKRDGEKFLEKAPLFYFFHQSLELDIFITLAKLLDGKRSDRNIIKFLSYCDTHRTKIQWKNGCIPLETITKQRAELDNLKDVIGKITIRRDKFLAHNDKDFFLNKNALDSIYPVIIKEVIELIRFFQMTLGNHSIGLKGSARISIDDWVRISADNFMTMISNSVKHVD